MKAYLDLMRDVLTHGETRNDRTGTGTRSLFGTALRFNLMLGFPAVTTKRLAFKQVAAELACFLNERETLDEFHTEGCTVWDGNAKAESWVQSPKCRFPGDVGRHYGLQWRSWGGPDGSAIDQLGNAVRVLRNDPYSRRAVVSAWNPEELDAVCLPPCHTMFQFSVRDIASGEPQVDCAVTMRSVDVFLGMPFDIASYALLTHLVANELDVLPGHVFFSFADTHIYTNHIDQCHKQLALPPRPLPVLRLTEGAGINNFYASLATLSGYDPHPPIPGELNV